MDKVKQNENVLVIWNNCKPDAMQDFVTQIQNVKGVSVVLENSEMFTESSRPLSSFNVVFSNWLEPHSVNHSDHLLALISKVLKPYGRLYLHDESDLTSNLKLNGFVNVIKEGNTYIAEKPSFEIGSKAPIKIGQKDVWKLDETVEAAWNAAGDDEIINADELLDDKDHVKPDKASLRVCATTGKRKACADCTCGLIDELSGAKGYVEKSSCGSCYLGDAFRCASCPYLGMPAFKPGEQVKLDLDSDI